MIPLGAGRLHLRGVPTASAMTGEMLRLAQADRDRDFFERCEPSLAACRWLRTMERLRLSGFLISNALNAATLLGDRRQLEFSPLLRLAPGH